MAELKKETQFYFVPRNLEDELFFKMVALKAWQIWKDEGCPDGRAEVHWQMAHESLVEVREIEIKLKSPQVLLAD